jgi:hypothetical protein
MALPKVIELEGDVSTERIPVFSLKGETYTMPQEVDTAFSLLFLEKMAENQYAAMLWLVKELFGREGLNALRTPGVPGSKLKAVMEVASDHVMGQIEGN